MLRNVANQKWVVFAFDITTNAPVTGDAANITANIRKDFGVATAVTDTNPTELEDGYYVFDITQAETNGYMLLITPESSTSNVQVYGIPDIVYTTEPATATSTAAPSSSSSATITSAYQYTSDLINNALWTAGEKIDGTSDFNNKALEYVNRGYLDIIHGGGEFGVDINEDWFWLRKNGVIILEASINTGTVSVGNNSSTITFSSAPTKDLDGWFLKIDGHYDIFRIYSHTVPETTATLDSVYTGTTDSAAGYKLFKLEYDLPTGAIGIVNPMTTQRNNGNSGKIDGVGINTIPPAYLARVGVPTRFSQIDDNTIRFDKYADTEMARIDYTYTLLPSILTNTEDEEPLVPQRHRKVLADIAAFYLLLDKNDDRADAVSLIAKAGVKSMEIENRQRSTKITDKFGQINSYYNRNITYSSEPYQ